MISLPEGVSSALASIEASFLHDCFPEMIRVGTTVFAENLKIVKNSIQLLYDDTTPTTFISYIIYHDIPDIITE